MTQTPRILVLADADAKVGGGHVMRCLTLAGALERAGAECAFVAVPAARAIIDAFADGPVDVLPLDDDLSFLDLAAAAATAARAWPASAIIVDHYGFGPAEDAILAAACDRLLIVDDLRRRHANGLVLDSNIGRAAADYPGRDVLAGPQFALVRPAFAARRSAALARRGEGGPVGRVLVSLGLGDAGAITGRAVRALLPSLGDASLDVVVGRTAPSLRELEALAGDDARLVVHVEARDMAELIAAADLAVGAGGSSVWERCCLGLPSLTVILADNQRENTTALAREGATVAVAPPSSDFDARLRSAFDRLMTDAALRKAQSAAAAGLCDGLGADRAAERLLAWIA